MCVSQASGWSWRMKGRCRALDDLSEAVGMIGPRCSAQTPWSLSSVMSRLLTVQRMASARRRMACLALALIGVFRFVWLAINPSHFHDISNCRK